MRARGRHRRSAGGGRVIPSFFPSDFLLIPCFFHIPSFFFLLPYSLHLFLIPSFFLPYSLLLFSFFRIPYSSKRPLPPPFSSVIPPPFDSKARKQTLGLRLPLCFVLVKRKRRRREKNKNKKRSIESSLEPHFSLYPTRIYVYVSVIKPNRRMLVLHLRRQRPRPASACRSSSLRSPPS